MDKILDEIKRTGQLPTINTSVEIESDSLINLAISLIIAAVVIMLMFKVLIKK